MSGRKASCVWYCFSNTSGELIKEGRFLHSALQLSLSIAVEYEVSQGWLDGMQFGINS